MERFPYRLAKSPYSDRFVLKGALLLTAWRAPLTRPTMDIDLAGKTSNEFDHVAGLVAAVCVVPFSEEADFKEEPSDLERLVIEIGRFSLPLLAAVAVGDRFDAHCARTVGVIFSLPLLLGGSICRPTRKATLLAKSLPHPDRFPRPARTVASRFEWKQLSS
jgi:hypothetical protein